MTDIVTSSATMMYPELDFGGKTMILLRLHTFSRMLSIITGLGRLRNMHAWALACGAAIVTVGCDKVPLLAPGQSTITLSSGSSVVQANGTTEIRATVLEQSGTPVQNGTTVTFTTNLGTLAPTDARTMNGVATVQFLGNGQSGKASIKAISGGAASEALELSVGAGAAGRISLTANPAAVPASGGTTTISAVVLDASGNALGGVPVSFTTTAGSFSAQVVNTDLGGRASTTLTTNREATVTASAGGTTTATVTVSIAVRPTVAISVASGSTPAEGSITTLSVTVTPATNAPPLQSVLVNYGDGSSDDLGAVSGTVAVQHIYNNSGSFTATVTATDTAGSSATASTVIVVQPLLVSITATPSTGNPRTFNFTANVSPPGGAIASYAWTFGDGSSVTTSSATTSHTYAAAGDRVVRVTIRTTTNTTATGSANITVP